MSKRQEKIQKKKIAEAREAKAKADEGKSSEQLKIEQELKDTAEDPKKHKKALDKYYRNPPDPRYFKWRIVWVICLIGALVFTGLAWGGTDWWEGSLWTLYLVVAYICIGATIAIDFGILRKMRREYQRKMDPTAKKYFWD